MAINKKKVANAVKSVGKFGVDLAGKGIIGGAKILNKGLAKVDAHSRNKRAEGTKKRKAEKKKKVDARQAKIDARHAERNRKFKEGGRTLLFNITKK